LQSWAFLEQLYANGKITSQYPGFSVDDRSTAMNAAGNMANAVLFLMASDPIRFGRQMLSLKEDYDKVDDKFPTIVQAAVDLQQSWERDRPLSTNCKLPMHPKPKYEGGRDRGTRNNGGTAPGITLHTKKKKQRKT
jgi:hypothetical protein